MKQLIYIVLGFLFAIPLFGYAASVFTYSQGGSGTTTAAVSQLLYGGKSSYQSVATTTASCTGSASCSAFTVIGSSPITISASGGGGGSGSISTSSPGVVSRLLYYTTAGATPELVAPVATTSLTATSPLALSQAISVIGASASALSISTAGTWSGNAGTATALAANGGNCSAGQFPLGVDTLGAVETCTDAWTEAENTSAAYAAQATTLTIAGTAQQVTSSAGAQSLAANRTWTLSLPSYVLFPSSYSAALGSTTNATSTNLTVTSLASTTNLIVSSAGGASTRCLQVGVDGTVSAATGACGTAGSGAGTWATTTSSVSGQLINYPLNTTDIVTVGNTATTTAFTYIDPNAKIFSVGQNGVGTSSFVLGPSANKKWHVGTYNTGSAGAGNFVISSSSVDTDAGLTANQYFTISQGGLLGFGNASSTGMITATTASTTNLTVSSAGGAAGCATFSANGTISNTGIACGTGSGGAFDPFTHGTQFGQSFSGTSTLLHLTGSPFSLSASSTSQFDNSTTTQATITTLYFPTFTSSRALYVGSDNTVQEKATTSVSGSAPITLTANAGALIGGSNLTIACANADGATKGCILAADWAAFNAKANDPFTHTTYGGQTVSATSTGIWLTAPFLSLIASSTFATTASTTNATTTSFAISNLTSGNCVQVSTGGNLINSPNGACGSASGIASYDAFTHPVAGQSATTSSMFVNGQYFSLSSSTPFAMFSLHATSTTGNGVPTTLFAIASSTGGISTSTLFTVNNIGKATLATNLTVGSGGATNITGNALDIQGSFAQGNGNIFYSGGTIQYIGNGGDNIKFGVTHGALESAIEFTAESANSKFVFNTANVGIGTTSPYAKLAVTGTAGQTNPLFQLASSTDSPLFTVTNIGNTGIGTSSPFANLAVHALNGATNTTLFAIGSSTQTGTSTLFTVSNTGIASTTGLIVSNLGSGAGNCLTVNAAGTVSTQSCSAGGGISAYDAWSHTTSTNSATTSSIGIGSTTPWAQLSIHAVRGSTDTLFAIASSTASATTTLFSVSNTGVINSATANINLNGKGAGTTITGPDTGQLSILSGSGQNLLLGNVGGNSVNVKSFTFEGAGSITLGSTNFVLSTNTGGSGEERLRITNPASVDPAYFTVSNSFVGIASTTPYAALSVGTGVGTTGASSTIVVAEYRYGKTGNAATSTAATIDCRTSTQIHWPIGQSATTLTLTGLTPGQTCRVMVENPTTAAGALTWAVTAGYTLLWPANTLPTQTTTANRNDMWSFLATQGSSTIQVIGAITSF